MGLIDRTKNSETLLRCRHQIVFKQRLLRLYNLLEVGDDKVYTMVLIKLVKLIESITGKHKTAFYQVYEYNEVRYKIRIALKKAIGYTYYSQMKDDEHDYMKLSIDAFNEFRAYVYNAHQHYGVLTKI